MGWVWLFPFVWLGELYQSGFKKGSGWDPCNRINQGWLNKGALYESPQGEGPTEGPTEVVQSSKAGHSHTQTQRTRGGSGSGHWNLEGDWWSMMPWEMLWPFN